MERTLTGPFLFLETLMKTKAAIGLASLYIAAGVAATFLEAGAILRLLTR